MRFMSAITLTALVSGCATSGGDSHQYAQGASCDFDLAQTEVAASQFSDSAPEEGGYQTLMSDMFATAGTALLLSSNAGLGLSLGKSLGIGLAASMMESSTEEDVESMPAPAPTARTLTPEEIQQYLRASMQQSGLQAAQNLGLPQGAIERGLQYQAQYANAGMLVVSMQEGCIKAMAADGSSGACILPFQGAMPTMQALTRPMIADNNGQFYWVPGGER